MYPLALWYRWQNHISNTDSLEGAFAMAADMNKDGSTSIGDLVLASQLINAAA